jgi:hypothetical protein
MTMSVYNEGERTREEVTLASVKIYTDIGQEGLRKNHWIYHINNALPWLELVTSRMQVRLKSFLGQMIPIRYENSLWLNKY